MAKLQGGVQIGNSLEQCSVASAPDRANSFYDLCGSNDCVVAPPARLDELKQHQHRLRRLADRSQRVNDHYLIHIASEETCFFTVVNKILSN